MVHPVFNGLLGQAIAVDLLMRSLEQKRLAPAYLFAGPEGVGRRLAAQRFTELILAGETEVSSTLRRRIQQGNHPDLLWVEPTFLHQGRVVTPSEAEALGLKRRSSPQVRLSQIRDVSRFLSRAPLEAPRSVVVIEQAETMAESAANGLLKTLEEPGKATIILIAPGPHQLLPTLVSRCQCIPFSRLSHSDLTAVLKQVGSSEILDRPDLLALAQGSPGVALGVYQRSQAIPDERLEAWLEPPQNLQEALERGREIAKMLDVEAQLWLADYLQQCLWHRAGSVEALWTLEQVKGYLKRYCQPRLVWEVTLMELWRQNLLL